jgi:hypothetical protein
VKDKIIAGVDVPVVACDMSTAPDTPDERIAEYVRLFGQHLISRERTTDGIRFRLRAEEGVEAWVRDLAAREKACCPFADFAVATVDNEVVWDATVIDDDLARAVLDEFYRVAGTEEDFESMDRRLTGLGFTVTTRLGVASCT